MINNIFLIKLSELYPIGKFKYAPGTIASLFTCIIFFYLNTYFQIEIIILIFFIVFFISLLSIQNYLKLYGNKDHQSIVIDEFLGQYIALFSIPLFELENNIINISIIFLLFRFFDISKIGLRSIEKIPGTFGILFDDIIGGIYTIPIIYLLFLWFGKI
ncbi:MAG: phosphatidylglycerophosphatase A [Alphaproteobacteria bacterium]|nr:MAG: phosphatidylglycerophosphatase A [Alphaproteobacteria bacterium]